MILVIDNYDSFTWNLVDIVRRGPYPVEVFRYTVDHEAWEEYDRRGYSRRDAVDFDAIDDPFDERRFTVSAHVGIRL